MGFVYPLWSARSLSEEERAAMRARIEAAPATLPAEVELARLRDHAEVMLSGAEHFLGGLQRVRDPRLDDVMARIGQADRQTELAALRAEIDALGMAMARHIRLLPLLSRLPADRPRCETLRDYTEALFQAAALASLPTWLVRDASLVERRELLVAALRGADADNLALTLQAFEDRLLELLDQLEPHERPR